LSVMNKGKIFTLCSLLFVLCLVSGCGVAKPAAKTATVAATGIAMAVVAEHNTSTDCWLVIDNNIYNVTDYIPNHPGGEKEIADYCGKDATAAFETKGGKSGQTHSDQARQILAQFYIGDLAR
jgi:cytochrome b involved in lipid metabolism